MVSVVLPLLHGAPQQRRRAADQAMAGDCAPRVGDKENCEPGDLDAAEATTGVAALGLRQQRRCDKPFASAATVSCLLGEGVRSTAAISATHISSRRSGDSWSGCGCALKSNAGSARRAIDRPHQRSRWRPAPRPARQASSHRLGWRDTPSVVWASSRPRSCRRLRPEEGFAQLRTPSREGLRRARCADEIRPGHLRRQSRRSLPESPVEEEGRLSDRGCARTSSNACSPTRGSALCSAARGPQALSSPFTRRTS